jgi:hypothetical protein
MSKQTNDFEENKVKLLQNDYLFMNMIDNNDVDEYSKNIHFDQFFSNLIENFDKNYADDNNVDSSNFYIGSQLQKKELSQSNPDDAMAIMQSKFEDDDVLILEDKISISHKINKEIIGLEAKLSLENHYLEVIQKLNPPPVIQEIKVEDDDDVFFLHEDKAPVINQKSNYYDKDDEVDEKEVIKRWRCKKLSDHKINLSKSNYRYRIFRQKNSAQAKDRKFKTSIFENNFDDNIAGKLNNNSSFIGRFKTDKDQFKSSLYLDFNLPLKQDNNKKLPIINKKPCKIDDKTIVIENNDESIFNKRIEDIKIKYKEIEEEIKLKLREQKKSLLDGLKQQILMLKMAFEGKQSGYNLMKNLKTEYNNKQNTLKGLYLEAEEALNIDFRNEIKQNKSCEESEINALKVLFESGKYQKGKLDQYFTLETLQPAARRRRYDDNGYRRVLLTQEKLKNILIEDTIYHYYYGSP